MKKLLAGLALGVLAVMTASAELIENGNFAKGAAHWDLAVPEVYGPPPVATIKGNALELSGMSGAVMGYLTLNQAVNIQSNKKYKIRFEVRGQGTESFLVAIHDPGRGSHGSRLFKVEDAWKTNEFDFVGAYETEEKWVRKWIKATRDARLQGGRTIGSSLQDVDDPKGVGPRRTYLTFALGEMRAFLSIRNISIVEDVAVRP